MSLGQYLFNGTIHTVNMPLVLSDGIITVEMNVLEKGIADQILHFNAKVLWAYYVILFPFTMEN